VKPGEVRNCCTAGGSFALTFDIAVDDAHLVQVDDALYDLPREDPNEVFTEGVELLQHAIRGAQEVSRNEKNALHPTHGTHLAIEPPGTYSMKMKKWLADRWLPL
jgi:hypothetical protein